MRNPERIPKNIALLEKVWKRQPDTRFHQLIYNLQYEYIQDKKAFGYLKHHHEMDRFGIIHHQGSTPDLFNVEDESFFEWLIDKYQLDNNE